MRALMKALGDPQNGMRFVHVAGTNGKGSTCAMIASVLQAAGYRTGLYVSPHLAEYNERICIDGRAISDSYFCSLAERVFDAAAGMEEKPTVFEKLTAMGFLAFRESECDVVVLEVGLGGKLDATNIIEDPLLCVISGIDLEHTETLGSTIAEIAAEKAGIIKAGCPVVAASQDAAAEDVFRSRAVELGCGITFTDPSEEKLISRDLDFQVVDYRQRRRVRLPLVGVYQYKNLALALDAIDALSARGLKISEAAVYAGLAGLRWPGRFEVLKDHPPVIVDGAHNPSGARELSICLSEFFPGRKITLVMGVLSDKDYRAMLDIMAPHASDFVIVTPPSGRALPAEELAAIIRDEYGIPSISASSVKQGVAAAMLDRDHGGPVCIFGSLYQIGEVRAFFGK